MKMKRDTAPAIQAAAKSKGEKREAKKWEIINLMCTDWCEPEPDQECFCRESAPPKGVLLLGCISMSFIVDHLNHKGIETLSGKTGKWQVTLLRNVFKEEYEQLQQSKTAELPNSDPNAQTGITW